jgi:hypothetical protein
MEFSNIELAVIRIALGGVIDAGHKSEVVDALYKRVCDECDKRDGLLKGTFTMTIDESKIDIIRNGQVVPRDQS